MKEVFEYALQERISSRHNYAKLEVPFLETTMRQNSLSYIDPSIRNKFRTSMKETLA